MEEKMIHIEQWEKTEKELEKLKEQYAEIKMPKAQLEQLKMAMEKGKADNRKDRRKKEWSKLGVSVASAIMAFVILPNTSPSVAYAMEKIPVVGNLVKLVTWRDYQYEDERQIADISVAKLEVEEAVLEEVALEEDTLTETALEESVDEINAEIEQITNQLIAEFETFMEEEQGYQELIIENEVVAKTEEYFTLNLFCYQANASGYEQNFYYTIVLTTGERIFLKDLFEEGADYISVLSDEIKVQMKEQMAADENVSYWLEDEMEEFNFNSITEETSFYLNREGNVVICFNEGEVAPMYMGCVEFEIAPEIVKDIRK